MYFQLPQSNDLAVVTTGFKISVQLAMFKRVAVKFTLEGKNGFKIRLTASAIRSEISPKAIVQKDLCEGQSSKWTNWMVGVCTTDRMAASVGGQRWVLSWPGAAMQHACHIVYTAMTCFRRLYFNKRRSSGFVQ